MVCPAETNKLSRAQLRELKEDGKFLEIEEEENKLDFFKNSLL